MRQIVVGIPARWASLPLGPNIFSYGATRDSEVVNTYCLSCWSAQTVGVRRAQLEQSLSLQEPIYFKIRRGEYIWGLN